MEKEKEQREEYDKNIDDTNGRCVDLEVEVLDEPEDYSDVELPEDDNE